MKRVLWLHDDGWEVSPLWIREIERNEGVIIETRFWDETFSPASFEHVFILADSFSWNRERVLRFALQWKVNPLRIHVFPWKEVQRIFVTRAFSVWRNFFSQVIRRERIPSLQAAQVLPTRKVLILPHCDGIFEKELQNLKIPLFTPTESFFVKRDGLDFTVYGSSFKEKVGAMVLFPEWREHLPFSISQETLDTGKIIDFSQFQNLVIQKRLRGKTVVFLVSQKNHSQKEWENMFLLSYALAKEEKAQVWVLLEEVMVARNSLEKKYREARSEGVLFEKIKMERLFFQPTTDMRGVWITFDSERDRYHLTIRADWAVYIPERECLPFSAISWWKDGVPVENFYQLENPNLPSFSSFLDGVFYFSQFDRDSLPWLAQTIDEYLTKGKIALPESSTIDEEKCVLCLTCFRTCPWKAIEIEGLTRRRKAHINWEQCHLCGICMAMCPASAIGIHSLPSEDFSFILCSEVMGNENSLNRV